MEYVEASNVPRPPVTAVTEPVSDTLALLAMVQVIWEPVPSGLLHDAFDVITLSGAAADAAGADAANAGVAEATTPTTATAEATPPVMTPRTRLGRRPLRSALRRGEFLSSQASRRIPPVPFVVANQG